MKKQDRRESQISGDRVLFSYSYFSPIYGKVLVTENNLVIGREKWTLSEIKNISVKEERYVGNPLPMNRNTLEGLAIGLFFLIAAMLTLVLMPQDMSPWKLILAGLLFSVSVLAYVVTGRRNPGTLYKLQLTLRGVQGRDISHEAGFPLFSKWHAEKAVRAVEEAIRSNEAGELA